MTGNGKKVLLDGRKYDKYFKKSEGKVTELPKAEVKTTLKYMERIVRKDSWQTKEISKLLKGSTVKETANKIYDFLYNHIQYELDANGIEQLRSPNRVWKDKKADCDCFAIFASSCLVNLGIEHSFRIAKYNGNDYYQHVYIVLDNGIIIDPVMDSFNIEARTTGKHDHKMSIRQQYLSGIPAGMKPTFGYEFDGILSGLGSLSDDSMLRAIKLNLENTLNSVLKEPSSIKDIVNPQTFINQVQYVLSKDWNNRAEVYAAIEKVETQDEMLNGLGGWGKKMWGKVKTGVKKGATKVKTAAKKVVKAIVSYNPLSLAMKGGLLLAFKVNLFGFTEKLKYGYYTESQAVAMSLDINTYRQVKGVLDKVKGMYTKLGGKEETLKKAILTGKNGSLTYPTATTSGANIPTSITNVRSMAAKDPVLKVEQFKAAGVVNQSRGQVMQFSMAGLGLEPVTTATTTTAASGLLATIGSWLKKVDWSKLKKVGTTVKTAVTNVKTFVDKKKATKSSNPYGTSTATTATTTQSQPNNQAAIIAAQAAAKAAKEKAEKNKKIAIGVGVGLTALAIGAGVHYNKKNKSKTSKKKSNNKALNGVPEYSV